MTTIARWTASLGAMICLPCLAMAQTQPTPSTAAIQSRLDVMHDVLNEPDVMWKHPDLRYRELGAEAYKEGDKSRALNLLLEASRYGDKPSEAMVAAMYWNGDGVAADHPRAYAWMDLAADRGYRDLAIQRELYWDRLSQAERDQALKIGRDVYDEYSDEQGNHRLALKLSRAALDVTGSHAGYVGNGLVAHSFSTLVTVDTRAGMYRDIDVDVYQFGDYYSSLVWKPDDYLRLKDLQWRVQEPLQGHVDVGELGPVSRASAIQPPG